MQSITGFVLSAVWLLVHALAETQMQLPSESCVGRRLAKNSRAPQTNALATFQTAQKRSRTSVGLASSIEAGADDTVRRHFASTTVTKGHGKVIHIVYSDSRFYNTRLQWLFKTWIAQLPRESLMVIGDAVPTQQMAYTVHATKCPAHSHGEGGCCKLAEAVILAHKLMQRDPSFTWAYFVDDDVYVRPTSLELALDAQGPGSNHGVVMGCWGCAAHNKCPGLCGGCGYAASLTAIERALGNSTQSFLAEQMDLCTECELWGDIAISQIYAKRGVEHPNLAGLYGFKLNKQDFDNSLKNDRSEPLMYHYITSWNQMELLHRLFLPPQGQTPNVSINAAANHACAEFRGNRQCAATTLSDLPWTL